MKTEQCERDAALMQKLGANAIRVYHVNESAEHSGCMNAFASHGIYVFVDLDSFKTYIRFVRPARSQYSILLTCNRTVDLHGMRTRLAHTAPSWTTSNSTIILLASSSATKSSTIVRSLFWEGTEADSQQKPIQVLLPTCWPPPPT